MTNEDKGLRERVTKGSEEAIGKLAQELLESPMVTGALSAAFQSRERAVRAQEVAMGALNLPSASDLERLTRRLRAVSQRLEGIEDSLDSVQDRIENLGNSRSVEERLTAIETALGRIEERLGSGSPGPSGSVKGSAKASAKDPAKGPAKGSAKGSATT
jgi:predicted  nucleic acid-binding Zn-ribbon protein